MRTRLLMLVGATAALVACLLPVDDVGSQPRKGGKDSSPRAAGHSAGGRAKGGNPSPAMTRPAPKASPAPMPKTVGSGDRPAKKSGDPPAVGKKGPKQQPAGGFQRPGTPTGKAAPKTGLNDRPKPGAGSPRPTNDFLGQDDGRPGKGTTRPGDPDRRPKGGKDDPKFDPDKRPKIPGKDDPKFDPDRRPKGGKDDPRIDPDGRPKGGKDDPKLDPDRRPEVDDRPRSPKVRVGDVNVNVDNSIDYTKDQKAWVDNRHATGNNVRANSGNRYAAAYGSTNFRRDQVGAYPYSAGWGSRGAYHGWKPATYAGFGAFMGAAWANPKPAYQAYGTGGNVYYEDNSVYVDGQAAGTVEQYAQQLGAQLAAAPPPATVGDADWLPLGAFALTREGVDDSQGMIELAVNKQGVLAGTYFNEATGVSRPVKGMADPKTQRVAIGFADGKNADLVLETVVYNLTQDEAPGMMHFGATEASPVLLVRLEPPAEPKR